MEDKSIEQELIECREQLRKANEQIEILEYRIEKNKKEYDWELRETSKSIKQVTDKNLELFDRESSALIHADELEKEVHLLRKEKKECEKKIRKLEEENEKLKEELIKLEERKNFSNDPEWRVLKAAGKQKAHS
jgi:chromosome segregation ATPase